MIWLPVALSSISCLSFDVKSNFIYAVQIGFFFSLSYAYAPPTRQYITGS